MSVWLMVHEMLEQNTFCRNDWFIFYFILAFLSEIAPYFPAHGRLFPKKI